MAKTFAISESMLRELYERQQLSVAEMAAVLSCKPSLLRKTMAECGILPRSRSEAMRIKRAKDPDRLVPIPPAALKRLYEACGWTAAHIAEHYGCSVGTVLNRLRLSGIALSPPGRPVVEIPRSELEALYLEQRLSLRQIARHYGCDHSTIKNKLEEYGLPLRNYAEANRIYPRRDFDGGEADKAYLVGFRLGDLHVTMMGEVGQTVVVECATTKQEQLDLIADLFAPYGHVYVGKQKRRGDVGITCYLNMSFAFLLPKEDAIPEWAQSGTAALTAFAAGYIDAEGSFYISQNIAHFSVSSYDGGILTGLHRWLKDVGVHCPEPRIVGRRGDVRPNGAVYRKDLWTMSVARKASLLRLIELLDPHLKHAKRRRDMQATRLNIEARNARRLSKTYSNGKHTNHS
jgi:hypothetical protein